MAEVGFYNMINNVHLNTHNKPTVAHGIPSFQDRKKLSWQSITLQVDMHWENIVPQMSLTFLYNKTQVKPQPAGMGLLVFPDHPLSDCKVNMV